MLVSATDGVGTKLAIARATSRYGTVGIDLVAMCVDDLVCSGAEPLFFLDYVAVGRLVPERIEEVVAGVADGCRQAGSRCSAARRPSTRGRWPTTTSTWPASPSASSSTATSSVPTGSVPGDVLIGLPSPGLRSNGYTLARHVLLERAALALDGPAWSGAEHSLADELLRPSVIYAPAVLAAVAVGAARRRRRRGARVRPHHRGRYSRQPGAGAPARLRRPTRPARLGDAEDLRRDRPAGRGGRRRDGSGVQPRARHGAGGGPAGRRGGPGGACRTPASEPGVVGAVVAGSGKVDLR